VAEDRTGSSPVPSNLALEESAAGRFVRRARMCHRASASGAALEYTIVQSTELRAGRVVRQVNALARED
jgi:hypothetical protein